MIDLQNMTQAKWDRLTPAQREALRDNSGLSPQLRGWEGWRVEVRDDEDSAPRRFIVGKSTGWRPCHLELKRADSSGGFAAAKGYASVRPLKKVRDF